MSPRLVAAATTERILGLWIDDARAIQVGAGLMQSGVLVVDNPAVAFGGPFDAIAVTANGTTVATVTGVGITMNVRLFDELTWHDLTPGTPLSGVLASSRAIVSTEATTGVLFALAYFSNVTSYVEGIYGTGATNGRLTLGMSDQRLALDKPSGAWLFSVNVTQGAPTGGQRDPVGCDAVRQHHFVQQRSV